MATSALELMVVGSEFSKGFRNQDRDVTYFDLKMLRS